jgi:anti-sigma factor RsiW
MRLELGAYLLGAIEPDQRAALDRHLANCTYRSSVAVV